MKFYNASRQRVSIYGLFVGSGQCVYVGQALDPQSRIMRHHKTKAFSDSVVFRTCKTKDAGRIEQQIISAYKRQGQCSLNKSRAVVCYTSVSSKGFKSWIPNVDIYFNSKSQAARFLGFSNLAVMSHAQKRGDCHCIELSEPFKIYQYDPLSKTGIRFARWNANNKY